MQELKPNTPPNTYNNFVQWDRRTMSQYRELINQDHVAASLLILLVEHMDKTNCLMCSVKTIQELLGRSRSVVYSAIKVLKDEKWLQQIKVGTGAAYMINATAFWQDKTDKKKYAKFSAMILASASEQDEDTLNLDVNDLKQVPVVYDEEILIEHDSKD